MNGPDRIAVLDARLRLVACFNTEVIPPEEILGLPVAALIAPRYWPMFERMVSRVLSSKWSEQMCVQMVPTGDVCWSLSATAVEWNGRPALLLTCHQLVCQTCPVILLEAALSE